MHTRDPYTYKSITEIVQCGVSYYFSIKMVYLFCLSYRNDLSSFLNNFLAI